MIDLLYHATIYYKIRKFVQESEPATLMYELVIEKAKAHECNILEYKDHQASHGGANSAPSYNNPLLSAHALSKRRPSGRGNNGHRCGKCGKSHERGNCPAYGKTCNKCQGINHFKAVCRSKVTAKMVQSPHQRKKSEPPRRGSTGSYNGQGKGGGNRQHQKKKTPKKLPKQNAYAVTMKNSVPSEVTTTSGGEREKQGNVSSKTVLSGQEEEGTYNRFSCFAVHSKMSQSTNAKSKPVKGLYTDTDPDDRSEIITDVTIRMPGKAGTMMMEVKVDPGAQPSCIPLQKFKTLFPHLCRDGLPKEGLLDNTQNEFQSYNGGDMTCYGHLLIDVKDRVTKKYHPIRFYVMNTDVPKILISHAAAYWLGLVKVLCVNKAPRIKRQVASIDKNLISKRKVVISGPVHQIRQAALRRNRRHRRWSLQERATFQVQLCTVSRTPKYKEGRRPLERDLAEMWTSVMGSSIAKRNHLQQLERSRRHQNRVTRSIQDQIRTLRIV